MNEILKVQALTKRFGGTVAINDCSITVPAGKIVGLIGPNGSGKTTLFGLISGTYRPDSGSVFFKNREITGLRPHKIARMGLARTFQVTRVFPKMSVIENMLSAAIHVKSSRQERLERARNLLNIVNLGDFEKHLADNISGGQQRLLELARALMPNPDLILLDEPTAGVHPVMIDIFLSMIKQLQFQGKTFLIVEHNMPAIMSISDFLFVLNAGMPIADGTPKEVMENENVIEAYLGQ